MTRKEDSNLRETRGPKRSNGGRREEAAAEGPPMRSEVVGREEARQERLVTMRVQIEGDECPRIHDGDANQQDKY